jgi:hypothetical protein
MANIKVLNGFLAIIWFFKYIEKRLKDREISNVSIIKNRNA